MESAILMMMSAWEASWVRRERDVRSPRMGVAERDERWVSLEGVRERARMV